MQGTADLSHDIPPARCPKPDCIFDQATAFNAADHVFNGNPSSGDLLIVGCLRLGQFAAFGFLDGPRVAPPQHLIALEAEIV